MKQQRGILNGVLSGLFWGADTALNGVLLAMIPLALMTGQGQVASLVVLFAFLHDGFSAIYMTGYLAAQRMLPSTFSLLPTRSAMAVIVAAAIGGPIGMRAYLYAVDTIGAGYSAGISAIYPVVAALLSMILLKEKVPLKRWVGLGLAVIAVALLSFDLMQQSGVTLEWRGFIAAFICVASWACESVFCSIGMGEDLTPEQALWIRQWTSTLVYVVFIIVEADIIATMTWITQQPMIWWMAGIAAIGTLSYLKFYQAIDQIGPVKATGLNVSYAIWASVMTTVLTGVNWQVILLVAGAMMMVASILVSSETT